jgi:hypothetical protein
MFPIGKGLEIIDSEINNLDFFDSIERAWDNVELFTLPEGLEGERYWFQDTGPSPHPSQKRRNCQSCNKRCTPAVKCCQVCDCHAQLASDTAQTQSVSTPDENREIPLFDLVVEGDMEKCISCLKFWPNVKAGYCDQCREELSLGDVSHSTSLNPKNGTASFEQNSFWVEAIKKNS